MYISSDSIESFLLAFIGLMNLLTLGYYGKLAYQLYKLYRRGENGLTIAMTIERGVLAAIFLWSFYQSIQNGFGIAEVEINRARLLSLAIRAAIGLLLLFAIAYQDREMRNGTD